MKIVIARSRCRLDDIAGVSRHAPLTSLLFLFFVIFIFFFLFFFLSVFYLILFCVVGKVQLLRSFLRRWVLMLQYLGWLNLPSHQKAETFSQPLDSSFIISVFVALCNIPFVFREWFSGGACATHYRPVSFPLHFCFFLLFLWLFMAEVIYSLTWMLFQLFMLLFFIFNYSFTGAL